MRFLIPVLAAVGLTVAGCNETVPLGGASIVKASAGAAPVALLSLDGAPPEVTARLASALSHQAEARAIELVPGDGSPRYKLKGYVAAASAPSGTTITWVWDLFDGASHRAQRLEGSETLKQASADPWQALDEATLNRIAGRSMDGVALFLTGGAEAVAARQPSPPTTALGFAASE